MYNLHCKADNIYTKGPKMFATAFLPTSLYYLPEDSCHGIEIFFKQKYHGFDILSFIALMVVYIQLENLQFSWV
jgi:hypothetical protein